MSYFCGWPPSVALARFFDGLQCLDSTSSAWLTWHLDEKMARKKGEDKNSKINGKNLKILAVSRAGAVEIHFQVEKRRQLKFNV